MDYRYHVYCCDSLSIINNLSFQHAEGEIVGSSGRCISLLLALKSLLLDSLTQLASAEDLNSELETILKPNLTFLKQVTLDIPWDDWQL